MSDAGPGQRPSDEADANQLRMARAEEDAYQTSLAYMIDNVADTGAMRRVGDYGVAIAQERAGGVYHLVRPSLPECLLSYGADPVAGRGSPRTPGGFVLVLEIGALDRCLLLERYPETRP